MADKRKEMANAARRLRGLAKTARKFARVLGRIGGDPRAVGYDYGAADAYDDAAREILHTLRRVYRKVKKRSFARREGRAS